MIDKLGGLPAHPLIVHIPVAFVPLATIAVIVLAVRPRWLRSYGWLAAVFSGVGFLGALVAASSGESLEDDLRAAGETISGTLHDHVELGDTTQVIAGVFFVLTLLWVLFAWWRRRVGDDRATAVVRKPRVVAAVMAVLVVLSGVTATTWVIRTGHSGAKSVWETSG